MARRRSGGQRDGAETKTKPNGGATTGHEADLWAMADALRGSMDAAEYRGRVYDPCCGSSGMFVQSVAFIRAHASGNGNGGRARGDISIYGQESNYTTWRLAKMNLAIRGIEEDLPGFCKSAPLDEVRRHGHVLTPGRYVGAEPQPEDAKPFEDKMRRLVAELQAQQAEGARLDAAIAENLKALGFGKSDGGGSLPHRPIPARRPPRLAHVDPVHRSGRGGCGAL